MSQALRHWCWCFCQVTAVIVLVLWSGTAAIVLVLWLSTAAMMLIVCMSNTALVLILACWIRGASLQAPAFEVCTVYVRMYFLNCTQASTHALAVHAVYTLYKMIDLHLACLCISFNHSCSVCTAENEGLKASECSGLSLSLSLSLFVHHKSLKTLA